MSEPSEPRIKLDDTKPARGITRKDVELLLATIKQAIANGKAASA